jgi:hypothetical protein
LLDLRLHRSRRFCAPLGNVIEGDHKSASTASFTNNRQREARVARAMGVLDNLSNATASLNQAIQATDKSVNTDA